MIINHKSVALAGRKTHLLIQMKIIEMYQLCAELLGVENFAEVVFFSSTVIANYKSVTVNVCA